jgi:peptide deformylase
MAIDPEYKLEVPPEIRALWDAMGGPITKFPDPVLEEIATPISKPDASTRQLVERMKAAMIEWRGIGLAAPQIGVSQRVIIYQLPSEDDDRDEPLRVIVNPKIASMKGEQVGPEGCLSIPRLQGDVKRANEVIVKGLDLLGRPFRRRARELEARVIQHEVDHLDGILFFRRAEAESLHWLVGEEVQEAEDPEMRE